MTRATFAERLKGLIQEAQESLGDQDIIDELDLALDDLSEED